MRTLLIKEKRYPSFCRNRPDILPMYYMEDDYGKGNTKCRIISKTHFNGLMASQIWNKIRSDETLDVFESMNFTINTVTMKSTEHFKQVIQHHLERRASEDSLFAASFTKEGKSIDDCIAYILNTVKSSNRVAYTDDEVYGLAVHYYDEDNLEVGKMPNCEIVCPQVELTEEELKQARRMAMDKAISDERERIMKKPDPKKMVEREKIMQQPTLF